MPMTEAQVGDQTIRYDRDATAAVYATLEHGDSQRCGCAFCRNFAAQRHLIYPPSFRTLLEELGIDPDKEGEAFEYGPVDGGCHLYGGWFYLVGEMVAAGERNYQAPGCPDDGHPFEFFFTTSHPRAAAFGCGPVLAVEFTARLGWVLPESPRYRTASGKIIEVGHPGKGSPVPGGTG